MKRQKGTVVRIGPKWYARWTVNGERVYGVAHETKDAAELDRINNAPDHRTLTRKREVPTLQDWALECMEGRYGKSLADSTFDTNETIRLSHLDRTPLGKKRLHQITRNDCQAWVDGLRVTKTKKVKGAMKSWKEDASPSYIRRIAAYTSKLLALAVRAGHIKSSPWYQIEMPKVKERENRTLSPNEAMMLLNPQTRTDAIMLVAMHTGMRRSELAGLLWSHVSEDMVNVPGTKSEKSKAKIPLTPEAKAAIDAQPRRSIFVFSTESGKPLSPHNITRDVKARKEQLGIPAETRLHDLRGSYVSLLIESGADIRTVQDLARHADPRTTMKMYARSRHDVRKAAIANLRATVTKQVDEIVEGSAKSG